MTATTTHRESLQVELRQLVGLSWTDPSNTDLLDRIARLKDELAALDGEGS